MFPSFLCIGAQKAGTTWLYDNIKDHPQVWMAPVKEIFYFDGARPSRRPLWWQLCERRNRELRRHIFRAVQRRLKRSAKGSGSSNGQAVPLRPTGPAPAASARAPAWSKAQQAAWHLRFMLLPRNDKWYASLFQPGPGQIAGDINPYLAHMDHARVAHIGELMPETKIIYLIRNPVDRLWSELGMALRDSGLKGLDGIDGDYLEQQLTDASKTWLSTYIKNLQTWRDVFPQEQIFVGFFDQLRDDAPALLRAVLDFIGVGSGDEFIPPAVTKKSNASGGPSIPERYLHLLSTLFMKDLEELHAHFANSYTESWLDRAREAVTS